MEKVKDDGIRTANCRCGGHDAFVFAGDLERRRNEELCKRRGLGISRRRLLCKGAHADKGPFATGVGAMKERPLPICTAVSRQPDC